MCVSLFFNKVAGCEPTTLLNKKLQYRCFPVNFEKLLKKYFLLNISWRVSLTLAEQNTSCLSFIVGTDFSKMLIVFTKKIFCSRAFPKNQRSKNLSKTTSSYKTQKLQGWTFRTSYERLI